MCVDQQHQENCLGSTQVKITKALLSQSVLTFNLLYQDILVIEIKISDFLLKSDHARDEKFWRCKIVPNILVCNRINLPEITLTLKLTGETTCKLFLLE